MIYRYANLESYEDFASGRVLYHAPGVTNFPARLAMELMGRCLDYAGVISGAVLYDPLCGAGYLLTIAAITHAAKIGCVRGTDVDVDAVRVAKKNLSLLTPDGLLMRRKELREMGERFGRESYAGAAESAEHLAKYLRSGGISAEAFCADAFHLPKDGFLADIVLTDFPYGDMKTWASGGSTEFLATMRPVLKDGGVLCAVSDKAQKLDGAGYQRLERGSAGKRKFEIFQK